MHSRESVEMPRFTQLYVPRKTINLYTKLTVGSASAILHIARAEPHARKITGSDISARAVPRADCAGRGAA